MFDLQEMVKSIKNIPGIIFRTEEYFNFTFDYFIKEKDLRYSNRYITFDETRASKVLNYKEFLYQSICEAINQNDAKIVLRRSVEKNYKILFEEIDFRLVVDKLIFLMEYDDSFDNSIKIDIYKLYDANDLIGAYNEFLFYAVKIEFFRRQKNIMLSYNKNNILNKCDKSIIGNIIEKIVENKYGFNNVKHIKTWTIDDKIKRNKLNYCLQIRVKNAFVEYENVMNVIDEISCENIMTSKYLYSYYENIYYKVLNDVLQNDINEENILNMSSIIFEKVDSKIFEELFLNKLNNMEYEIIRYNLFLITVTVFYQCKFLLKMED